MGEWFKIIIIIMKGFIFYNYIYIYIYIYYICNTSSAFASNLSMSRRSYVGSLFSDKDQNKAGPWRNNYTLLPTSQPGDRKWQNPLFSSLSDVGLNQPDHRSTEKLLWKYFLKFGSRFGLAVRLVSRRTFGSNPLRDTFLFKSCGLWTLSCDFIPHNYWNIKLALIVAHLNAGVILLVTLWQYPYYIISLPVRKKPYGFCGR